MGAQGGSDPLGHGRRLLEDRHGAVGAVVGEIEIRAHEVDAAGLQPLRGPARQVAARGGLELTQQVRQLGVAPRVLGEVGVDALAEVVLADPGDKLP